MAARSAGPGTRATIGIPQIVGVKTEQAMSMRTVIGARHRIIHRKTNRTLQIKHGIPSQLGI